MAKKEEPRRITPFNPLDKRSLGEKVAEELLNREVEPLPPQKFKGAGIYAIYYTGAFEYYEYISERNINGKYEQPIYVGKAIPAGARKGYVGIEDDPGTVLFSRLSEHADTIEKANNLELNDFGCRYLVVEDIWIPLAESLLIEKYSPLWNVVLDGFGNHDPGKGRYNQRKSSWDVIHPGREWAEKCQESSYTREEILDNIVRHLRSF